MSTCSSARNLFSPLDNPELTIRRRSRVDPTLLNDFKMATDENGDPPVPDLRTMEELCQPSLNGRNSCQFHGLSGDDANKHLDKFMHVTQSIKVNGVTDDALRLGTTKEETNSSKELVMVKTASNLSSIGLSSLGLPSSSSSAPNSSTARSFFLKTERALIDVYKEELTFPVGKDAITLYLDRTSRYSANYNDMTVNRIDVIVMTCEEYSQEVLGFSDVIASGNPTPYYDAIISTSFSTLIPFVDSDFLLEEVNAFLALKDDPTSSGVDQSYCDTEGDIILLEAFLNDDPSLPTPTQGMYLPQVRKELKICEAKIDKSLIDEPPEGINLEFYTHKILMEDDFEPAVQHQRRVNPKIHEVIKKEVLKLLNARLIYPISDSPWVSLVNYIPKKDGFTVVENEENELFLTRLVMGWRVCIDYYKLNEATHKDYFLLPFMDQMLERLAGNEYYCFLDGFLGYFHILINPKDQEKTTFTCPYEMFAYCCMPFSLCNARGTFQRCMMAIFHDMIEKTMEVFMDDFSVFGNSFRTCLSHLEKMLKWCEDTNLCLNWEKRHFIVKEGIVLGHKISKNRIEVDKGKVDIIAKLPHPTIIKGIRSFLGHARFYQRFIQDFSKIARLMTRLLEKDTPFLFSKESVEAFQTLKRKLTEAPILIAPDWDLPFKHMCDANDFAIGAIKSSGGVFMAKKLFTFSRLATMDPPGDTMARTTPPKRPFPSSRGNKYILVAIDYLSKWVEVKALPTNNSRVVCKFLKSLFARFGTPRAIISDRGTHFCNVQFAKVMLKYGVTHRLATAYHPQTSRQVEVLNRGLKETWKGQ
nr:reverse transcriptase domain-containing protein [Tanacetum cinerariifolium]